MTLWSGGHVDGELRALRRSRLLMSNQPRPWSADSTSDTSNACHVESGESETVVACAGSAAPSASTGGCAEHSLQHCGLPEMSETGDRKVKRRSVSAE